MKKMLLLFIIISMVIPSVFAAKLSSKAQSEILVFTDMATTMDASQKMLFYNQNKKGMTAPLLLNIFLGCGIGSYVAGDTTGGTIGLVGELGSAALLYVGYITTLKGTIARGEDGSATKWTEDFERGAIISYASLAAFAAVRIYEIVRACTYTSEYNRQLSNALYSSPIQVGFAPIFENNEMKLSLAAKVSF